MSKGQAEATEVIFIVATILISVALMVLIFQKTIGDIQIMTDISSADSLARSIESIATVSNAAPGDIKTTYQAPEGTAYNIEVKDKNFKMEKLGEGERTVESSVYGITSETQASLQNINTITFIKTKDGKQIFEGK